MTMKINPKISFSFFLLLCIATAAPMKASGDIMSVKDTNGEALSPKNQYFIQPASDNGGGGGLVPANVDFLHICPLGIVQTPFPFIPGVSVTITSPRSSNANITTNTDLTITFQPPIWLCPSSKIWKVNLSFNKAYITTGGVYGEKESLFRIEEYGNEEKSYKLVYYERGLRIKGRNVGATTGVYGRPILVLNAKDDKESNAFPLKFKKAKTSMENIVLQKSL